MAPHDWILRFRNALTRRSLFRRVLVYSLTLSLSLLVLMGGLTLHRLRHRTLQEAKTFTASMHRAVSLLSLDSGAEESLWEQAKVCFHFCPPLHYIVVTSPDGTSLVMTREEVRRQIIPSLWFPQLHKQQAQWMTSEILPGKRVYNITLPIPDASADRGWFHAGFSTHTLALFSRGDLTLWGVFGLLTLALTGGVSWLFSRRLTRPLSDMEEFIRRVGNREMSARLNVKSGDEMGSLGEALNRMAADLENACEMMTAEQERAQGIFDAIIDSVIVINPRGRIEAVNRATRDLLGLAENELVGRDSSDLLQINESIGQTGGESVAFKSEIRNMDVNYINRDGERIPMSFNASLLRNHRGGVMGIVGVARDTRPTRRLLEQVARALAERERREELQRAHDALEAAHLELKDTQQRMIQSEKMAAIGALAGGVAHEINNPLAIIKAFIQPLARRIKEGDPLALTVRSIERETNRCIDLVKNLLLFSRSYKVDHREPVNLNESLEETLSLVLTKTKINGVNVELNLTPQLPPLMANRNQIQQILVNLCNNALDVMPNGGDLSLSTSAKEVDGQPGVLIQVRDTGPGVPEEIRGRIFEPFFTTKEVGKGTGLGLTLVYEIVRKHGGTVELEPSTGTGACFTVWLPQGDHTPTLQEAA